MILSTFLLTHPRLNLQTSSDVFGRFRTFSGGTDLRTDESAAKFDAETDFEVRLGVAFQKPNQNSEKLIFRSEKLRQFFEGALKNEMHPRPQSDATIRWPRQRRATRRPQFVYPASGRGLLIFIRISKSFQPTPSP